MIFVYIQLNHFFVPKKSYPFEHVSKYFMISLTCLYLTGILKHLQPCNFLFFICNNEILSSQHVTTKQPSTLFFFLSASCCQHLVAFVNRLMELLLRSHLTPLWAGLPADWLMLTVQEQNKLSDQQVTMLALLCCRDTAAVSLVMSSICCGQE